MYGIYCATCHGTKGDGNGVLAQREKFEGVPKYKDQRYYRRKYLSCYYAR